VRRGVVVLSDEMSVEKDGSRKSFSGTYMERMVMEKKERKTWE
jgi:hypothetical protein